MICDCRDRQQNGDQESAEKNEEITAPNRAINVLFGRGLPMWRIQLANQNINRQKTLFFVILWTHDTARPFCFIAGIICDFQSVNYMDEYECKY